MVSDADVPFGGLDGDQLFLGVQTPKNRKFGSVNRHFKLFLQKKSNPPIFTTMYRISTKFDRLMYPNEKTSWVVLYGDIRIPRWRTAAILNLDFWP